MKKRKPFHFVPVASWAIALRDSVNLAVELEPVLKDLRNDSAALVLAFQIGSRRRQAWVKRTGHLPRDAEPGVQRAVFSELRLRCPDAKIRVVGDLQRPSSRPLGEATLGQSLNAPCDSPEQELSVR